MPEPTFEEMIDAMKDAVAVLQTHDIQFALGGGLAAWARGGPRSEHDVDLLIHQRDTDAALAAFEDAGMRTERPPEGWLVKAWHPNGTLVDLIFSPAGGPITEEALENAPEIEVMALRVRVIALEDLLMTKLLALNEQEPDFGSVLELARALREQIDWDDVRTRTESSPFARAFFTLVEGLGIVEPAGV
jgi:predicted nucleotidyltransferase